MSNFVRSTASSGTGASSGSNVYESIRAVHEYLLFHYGQKDILMPYSFGPHAALSFPERTAQICGQYVPRSAYIHSGSGPTRALDLGCAVGGAAFELTQTFDEVVGIDFSHQFVATANTMKTTGTMEYSILKQGHIFENHIAVVPAHLDRTKTTFAQGDACNLDSSLGTFDLIHGANLLCRLPSPRKFLKDVTGFLNAGGHLVLISPYSWLEEYTALEEWIGGTTNEATGAVLDSASELQKVMDNISAESSNTFQMKLVHEEDTPFLIREHERKFQYGVSHCTVWQKVMVA
jgi:putative 4-mercaptohistidine N1-methyltranferase